jgi:hypothetical protein
MNSPPLRRKRPTHFFDFNDETTRRIERSALDVMMGGEAADWKHRAAERTIHHLACSSGV